MGPIDPCLARARPPSLLPGGWAGPKAVCPGRSRWSEPTPPPPRLRACPLPAAGDTPCFPRTGRDFRPFRSLLNPWCSNQCGTDRALSSGRLLRSSPRGQPALPAPPRPQQAGGSPSRKAKALPSCGSEPEARGPPLGSPTWGSGRGRFGRSVAASAGGTGTQHALRAPWEAPQATGQEPAPSPNFLPGPVEAQGLHPLPGAPV